MLCDDFAGYGSSHCNTDYKACKGTYVNHCGPYATWTSGLNTDNSMVYDYFLSKGLWSAGNNYRSQARSVRCVSEL